MIYVDPILRDKVIDIGRILLEAVKNNGYKTIAVGNTNNDDEDTNIVQSWIEAGGLIYKAIPHTVHKKFSGEKLEDVYDKYDMVIMLHCEKNADDWDFKFRMTNLKEFGIDDDKPVYLITYVLPKGKNIFSLGYLAMQIVGVILLLDVKFVIG